MYSFLLWCRANMDIMLASLGLRDSFEVIVIGEECTRPKPYPDPYLEAAQKLGMSPSDVIIAFEDSPSGENPCPLIAI